jgi:hypothetical protein
MSARVTTATVAFAAALAAAAHAQAPAPQPESALLNGLSRDLACAPASPRVKPTRSLVVAGGREARKTVFGTGDALIIRGGAVQGVKVGDEYYVRRLVDDRFTEHAPGVYPISVLTAGTVQIVDAQNDFSVAVVSYNCDGIMEGDYLERFQRPTTPSNQAGAKPDFAHPARLILGAERRQVASPGHFMVLDRGSDHGIRQGQQLTIFRRTLKEADAPVSTVGTATVYSVEAETSIIRVDTTIDAVYVGDLVAIHR